MTNLNLAVESDDVKSHNVLSYNYIKYLKFNNNLSHWCPLMFNCLFLMKLKIVLANCTALLISFSFPLSLPLYLSLDLSLSFDDLLTIILRDAQSRTAAFRPCRHPISDKSRTRSSHRVRCTPLRLMPNWGSQSNNFLKAHQEVYWKAIALTSVYTLKYWNNKVKGNFSNLKKGIITIWMKQL